MSEKCVATRSSSRLMCTSTTKDNFMATDDFRRLLRGYVDVTDLFHTFRLVSKPWQRIAEEKIDEDFESGVLAFHDGNDISSEEVKAQEERRKPVKRVIFLLNIMVGENACRFAANLVVVDIPEGVESIGVKAFYWCQNLTTVSFPTTLTSLGEYAFDSCSSLENVDLLHTNLQELGQEAFARCSELKSMTIPDSLGHAHRLGSDIFFRCSKLVPSNIDVNDDNNNEDVSFEVIDYLRERSKFAALKMQLSSMFKKEISTIIAQNQSLQSSVSMLSAHTNPFTPPCPRSPPKTNPSTLPSP
ncbi:hypothetical protein TrLO_g14209 [Triparma laevis f. longispina]|uniref:Uncharacterized protein n=1 Tax=Triparma laevis f. longispina TaxID=1714387 RepID=A0A9W7BYX4_9STRA|nr:hypothetical protein TrLO_g14209 [Triparma laevis f. longispina]